MTLEQMDHAAEVAEQIAEAALALSKLANLNGILLTITTQANQPLAMGNYAVVIGVRPSHANYRSQP